MSDSFPATPARRRDYLLLAIGAVAFGVAHTQAPLYFSNQHQYFVHGLAAAGEGYLDRDWLANTADPTPVFSAFVAVTHRHLHDDVFHAVYFVLLGVYFVSLVAAGSLLIPPGPARLKSQFVLGVLLIVVHAGIVRLASVKLCGVDYPWFFQAGVANQYVLGPGLQPSAFGVLLVASVAAFAYGRPALATILIGIACAMHPTYLLPGAILTATYMLLLYREGRDRPAAFVGVGALVLVSPIVLYTLQTFEPTWAFTHQESQRILAQLRIPHHTQFRRWFDLIAGLQVACVGVAILLARGRRLGWLVGVPAVVTVALSVAQLIVESNTFALLFPWRTSVVLVPLATAIVFARLARLFPERRWVWAGGVIVVSTTVTGGVIIMADRLAYHANDLELPALEYIRDHKTANDVYLIPVRVPASAAGPRGVPSTTFTPPPTERHQIRVDLQRFRLFTGVPLYVDFKAIPYKDADVLEWYRRLKKAEGWYARRDWNDPELIKELRDEGITHVLMTADRPITGDGFEQVYADDVYRIYKVP